MDAFPADPLGRAGHAGMKLILRRDRSVIADAALERFLQRFVALLTALTEGPQVPLSRIIGALAEAPALIPAVPAAPAHGTARAPQTPSEIEIAGIWAEVLPGSAPQASDNFFAIGGHSLLAAKVVTRLRQRFGVALAVRAMFDHPVLGDLALHLDALRAASPTSDPAADPDIEGGETVMEF